MRQKKTRAQIRAKIRWGIAGIFALLIMAMVFNSPGTYNRSITWLRDTVGIGFPTIPERPFKLGLDLQGGAHLVYRADVVGVEADEQKASLEGVRDVIERRVNGMGVGEPQVQTTRVGSEYRLIVELPGVTDVNQAITMIGQTPILEFKEPDDTPPRDLTDEEQNQLETYNEQAEERIEAVQDRLKKGEATFEELVQEVSEDAETRKNNAGYIGFILSNEVSEPIYTWAEKAAEGDVSPVIENQEGFNIARRGTERQAEERVEASHILVCYAGAQHCTSDRSKEDALALATDLFDQANARNFADLAKEHSSDLGSGEKGGSLGDFTRGRMVPEFEQAVFSAEPGQIIGPVETAFGFHIIYKTDQFTPTEYEISRILIRKAVKENILPPNDGWKNTGLSGKQLKRAEVVTDHVTAQIQVALQFDSEGANLFAELTERLLGQQIAIFLDGEPISTPVVQAVITDGQAVITGSSTLQEARLLAQRLNAGALPVPIELISQQAIGATLGAETLAASLKAGFIALLLVMLFMVLYYRLPGVLSVVSLALYVSITLAIFKVMGVTLTLAGIAGLILSIGMAVDANVLIFERLKEELREGKSLKAAVEEGFERAWTSIRDGNVSTIITCLLLIGFGSSFVQGFAITLAVGVCISMFTAIVVTRIMLRFVVPWFTEQGGWLFLGSRK